MKILQVNCVYKKGSTGKITYDIAHELKKRGLEVVVCYGRGKKSDYKDLPEIYKTCPEWYSKANHMLSRISGYMYGGCWFSTSKLIHIISREKPDVVHLQCLNGYFVNIYRLLRYLNFAQIPTVMTLHAEFMFTGGCGYAFECNKWKENPGCVRCPRYRQETESLFFDKTYKMWRKMEKEIQNFDSEKLMTVAVSPWLQKRAEESSILQGKQVSVVLNGLDTDIFKPYSRNERQRKMVFHASPEFTDDPTHVKGGYYVLKLAEQMKNIDFVVAGNYSISKKVSDNVKLLGKISDQVELAKYYSEADVTLLTSRRETFSMVCAESLSCGTPVVGFKAGAPEKIAIPEYSKFVEFGNLKELKHAVEIMLNNKEVEKIREKAIAKYDRKIMINQYMEIYNSFFENCNTNRKRG